MERIRLVANDTKPELEFTLFFENNGRKYALPDDAEVFLSIRRDRYTPTIIVKQCIKTDPTKGKVVIRWLDGELDLPAGIYQGELEIVHGDGSTETAYNLMEIDIRRDFEDNSSSPIE